MQNNIYKGVNLGGWLILEKWITPSLFSSYKAEDEKTLSIVNSEYGSHIKNHYKNFVRINDVKWLADNNVNSVRIPVAYWNFFSHENFVSAEKYLDTIIKELIKNNITFIFDIHAAPGGQNIQDHSGKINECNFDKDANNIKILLKLIDYLVNKYSNNLLGIELLNEPDRKLNRNFLYSYYKQANEIIYSYNKNIITLISDEFRPLKINNELKSLNLYNIALDMHLYQCFSIYDKNLTFNKHIHKTLVDWKELIKNIQKETPVIIGEWSLGLENKTFKNYSEMQKEKALKIYTESQQHTFKECLGNYFWTYKTEENSGWNYRYLSEKNIITAS